MIFLINVYDERGDVTDGAIDHLWNLLAERTAQESISHKEMPARASHEAFVRSRPYRDWHIVATTGLDWVGAVYATQQNEIGIAILEKHRRRGYAEAAIKELMKMIRPLPAVPSKRGGRFIANVAPTNHKSMQLFDKLGRIIQVTFEL